jgi:hypothetical protein
VSTADDGKTLVLTLIAVLVYFVSYFFIYIERDPINVLSVDYKTALFSLIPAIAAVLIFQKIKNF